MNKNKALFRILFRTIFNLDLSLFLIAEFVIRASPTPAKTTNVAAAFPSNIPAKDFTQLSPFSPMTILKFTTIIPITAKALATSIPIILFFTDGCIKLCRMFCTICHCLNNIDNKNKKPLKKRGFKGGPTCTLTFLVY